MKTSLKIAVIITLVTLIASVLAPAFSQYFT